MTTEQELIEVEGQEQYLTLASEWHSGQDCMLYAFASSGGIELGTQRPWGDFVDRYLTDQEWHVSLWSSLESDVSRAAESAEKSGHDDATELREFAEFCKETTAMLRKTYGLEDSEAV